MMISPKSYYDLYLKDKNEKELLKEIKKLKKEIKQLKETMEHPYYITDNKPDEATLLWCNRLYIEQAKQALKTLGSSYKPTPEETFNENLSNIEKIEYQSHSYMDGCTSITVTFDKEDVTIEKTNTFEYRPTTKIYLDKEEFMDKLSLLYIGEWNRNYDLEKYQICVMDGITWDLMITFKNNYQTKKVSGNNAYPYNYRNFMDLLEDEDYLEYTIDKQTKDDLIQRMIQKMRQLPKGIEITTSQLLSLISKQFESKDGINIYDGIKLTYIDMISLDAEIVRVAIDKGIVIDNTIHNGEVLGMPYCIGYLIKDY